MNDSNCPNELHKKGTSHGEHGKSCAEKNSQPTCSSQCSAFNDTHITFRKKIPAVVPLMSSPVDSPHSLLLSPILLRPIRSLSTQNNFCGLPPEYDEEHRLSRQKMAASYQLPRTFAASKGAAVLGTKTTVDKGSADNSESRFLMQMSHKRGRHLSGLLSQKSMDSSCSNHIATLGNLVRMRNSSLGHSDPQISASVQSSSVRLRGKDGNSLSYSSASSLGYRRSLNASASPILARRCRSPSRFVLLPFPHAKTNPIVPLRTNGWRTAPLASAQDNRRWSVASLPSSSGYGTPGSNSAFSSEYSSQEQLCDILTDLRLSSAEGLNEDFPGQNRPRSRSLTNSINFGSDSTCNVVVHKTIYKERFPKAKKQMEEQLSQLIDENAPLSGVTSLDKTLRPESIFVEDAWDGLPNTSLSSLISRRSMRADNLESNPRIRLISDGATRFLHHQIVEVANDCLSKSRDDLTNASYFSEISQRLEAVIAEAHEKTSPESFAFLSKLVKHVLMIISRPARILECLEFDPDQFYHLLQETEGAVREQLGAGNARVPDLPQYIISKLGLNKNLMSESAVDISKGKHNSVFNDETRLGVECKSELYERRPPSEDDYETVRLISNGAYGAVYLVRHKETRQRYNHDVDSGDEDNAPMFGSFDTASPRHSVISSESINAAQATSSDSVKSTRSDSISISRQLSGDFYENKMDTKHDCPLSAAVLLRRCFSSQLQNNLSTSSNGTNETGDLNTVGLSADSSADIFSFSEYSQPAPAADSCPNQKSKSVTSPLPRFSVTCEPDTITVSSCDKKLSPVTESRPASDQIISDSGRSDEAIDEHDRTLQLEIPKQSSSIITQHSPAGSISSASSLDGASSNPLVNATPIAEQTFALRAPVIIK
uniref:Non-specific serine/threonine protein kinase n=1 Tax=Elaeophora elaphi TaxID=1147741 RepID=A0A0R3RX73_9BILA